MSTGQQMVRATSRYTRTQFVGLMVFLIATFGCVGARADLVQYAFTGIDGAAKTNTPDQTYANAQGQITFALSAGIDRKVRVQIIDAQKRLVSSTQSGLLGPASTFVVNGNTYYGAQLQLPAPPPGSYTIQSSILSSTGAVIATDSHPLVEATSGPGVGGVIGAGYGMCATTDLRNAGDVSYQCPINDGMLVGIDSGALVAVTGVTDSGAGVASATFTSRSQDGKTTFKSVAAQYDPAKQMVSIGNNSSYSINSSQFPDDYNGPLTFEFDIFDHAGNKTIVTRNVNWQGIRTAPNWSYVGVHNPNATGNFLPGSPFAGFDPYTPGMTVYENPIKLVMRIPREQWISNSIYGWWIVNTPNEQVADYQDANYAYKVVTFPFDPAGDTGHISFWRAQTVWGNLPLRYSVKLAPGVRGTPQIQSVTYNYDQIGPTTLNPNIQPLTLTNQDRTYKQITVNAAPQSYVQNVWAVSRTDNDKVGVYTWQCSIPIGATSCSVQGNWWEGATAGQQATYWNYYGIVSDDGAISSDASFPFTALAVDKAAPIISSGLFDVAQRTVIAYGNKASAGQAWGALRISSWSMTARNTATNASVGLNASINLMGAGGFTITADASALPDGNYEFTASATDSVGNSNSKIIGTYLIEHSPPAIKFSVSNGSTVNSLDNILITLSDPLDPSPTITAVSISGGPTNINTGIGARPAATAGRYNLEYPVLFPSAGPGTAYTLTVTAANKGGGVGTSTLTFQYQPSTVYPVGYSTGAVRMPAVPQIVTNLKSPPLKLNDGTLVHGVYDVQASLRADSTVSLVVNGVTVNPGDTATVSEAYDYGATGGVLNLQVGPAVANVTGAGYLMLNTVAPNAPIVTAEADVWSPANQVTLAPTPPAAGYTVDVGPVTLKPAKVNGTSDCAGDIPYSLAGAIETRGSLLPSGSYACAIELGGTQSDVVDLSTSFAGIQGYLHKLGDNALAFEPGLLYRVPATGQIVFYRAGPQSLTLQGTPLDTAAAQLEFQPGDDPHLAGSTQATPIAIVGQNQFAGRLRGTAPNPGLTMVVTDPAGKTSRYATTLGAVGSQIYTSDNTLWDTQLFGVDLYYTRRPDKVWHTDLNFSIQPPTPTISVSRQAATPVSTADTTIDGQIGLLRGGSYTFNPGIMGDWRAQVFQKTVTRDGNGRITATNLVPLGNAPVAVSPDGTFSVAAGQLSPGIADLIVKATLYHNGQPTSRTVSSGDVLQTVRDGRPVPGTLVVAQSSSGLVTTTQSWTPALNVQIDSRRLNDLKLVHWFSSADGGATWSAAVDTTVPALRPPISKSGTYLYRAQIVNKYSGLTADTNTVTVDAFQRPTISIQGATAGFVGRPATFTAVSDIPDTKFTWSVRKSYNDPAPQTFVGASISYTPPVPGIVYLTLVGEQAVGTISNPLRTRTVSALYSVAALKVPAPIISGPNVLETGKTATFKVNQRSPFNQNQTTTEKILGEWMLPDGSTVAGFEPLNLNVKPGFRSIGFRSWVDGLKDSTQQAATYNFTTWTYAFPAMVITTSMPSKVSPAQAVFTAAIKNPADARNTGGEQFTFTWTLPPGASVTSQKGATIGAILNEPGEQLVSVVVKDSRGNSQVASTPAFTIAPPAVLAATLALTGSDQWARAPSDVQAKVSVTSVPKGDVFAKVEYTLDGAPAASSANLGLPAVVHVDSPGNHSVTATVTSKLGVTTTATQSFSLVTGDSPVCNLVSNGSVSTSITVRASCSVKMGKIASLNWSINGQPTALSSSFITFSGQQLATLSTVRVTATTDKGQTGYADWSK
ncbi:Ig-like domain-containing protein [Burkholderia sp. MBR-1]|uniref:Ig-like domain-containing protein n=1 Tax=Burkholderia sp. MBR-1 TaxID=2732364 RepID=UPI0015EF977B|nr:Ig-like domain-containing protein [Burkholderia sp. MBR-1]QMI49781.1 DUF4165 domain-containing protein [Burkholderia sp. MBR-1]